MRQINSFDAIVSNCGIGYKITKSGKVKYFSGDWFLSSKSVNEIKKMWIDQVKIRLGLRVNTDVMERFIDNYIRTDVWQETRVEDVKLLEIQHESI